MTEKQCFEEIRKWESYPPRLTGVELASRRAAIFEAVGQYSVETFVAARKRYTEDENDFFPTPSEIRRLCAEIEARARESERPKYVTTFKPEDHTHQTPAETEALKEEVFFLLPYEAEHVECPKTVKATCPQCGSRHRATNQAVEEIISRRPNETTKWNPNHKGMLLCKKCESLVHA